MSRYKQDSATLIARDKLAELANQAHKALPLARANAFKDRAFSDPGHAHGPSILNPDIYEALRRKGYSKEKAARISNSK